MMDRCVECGLNVQKTDRWRDIKGYEGKYQISDKGEVQYWDDNKKEWITKAMTIFFFIKYNLCGTLYNK